MSKRKRGVNLIQDQLVFKWGQEQINDRHKWSNFVTNPDHLRLELTANQARYRFKHINERIKRGTYAVDQQGRLVEASRVLIMQRDAAGRSTTEDDRDDDDDRGKCLFVI